MIKSEIHREIIRQRRMTTLRVVAKPGVLVLQRRVTAICI